MSGWQPSRPPWDTQGQPRLPADDTWYSTPQGPRVIIKPHDPSARGRRQSHYATPGGEGGRGRALAGIVIGLAASVGLVAAAVQLTHVSWGEAPVAALLSSPTTSTMPATTMPTTTMPATTVPATTVAASPSGSPAGTGSALSYVLATPATAGGYRLTSPMSATIAAVGSAGASQLMAAVEGGGGKVTGSVTGEYLISGDQALGYAGYNGTFSPAAVMQLFAAGASGVTTEPAGPHGGELACGDVTASSSTGTACVWATTSTMGMVEFFGGTGLEQVPPAKAGSDVLMFRDDVESAKGGAPAGSTATPTSTATS